MNRILAIGERAAIRRLVAGDITQREAARAAFERAARVHGVDFCVERQCMAEVLAQVPNLHLRSNYRAAVLRQPPLTGEASVSD